MVTQIVLQLLTSNTATVVSVLVAAICLAFIYFVAVPEMLELRDLREKVKDGEVSASQTTSQVQEEINRLVERMEEIQECMSNANNVNRQAMISEIENLSELVQQLSSRMLNLANSVHLVLHEQNKDSQSAQIRGFRP